MESLSATVDARDAYTAGHSRRVQQLALAIGRELGLSHAELELLGHAALFHDIGKLGIPDAILLKPSSLTDEEWVIMASHAAEGASIIHVADAFDSMLTTRVYRPARPAQDALQELRRMAGSQFCPRCVGALDAIVETEMGDATLGRPVLVD